MGKKSERFSVEVSFENPEGKYWAELRNGFVGTLIGAGLCSTGEDGVSFDFYGKRGLLRGGAVIPRAAARQLARDFLEKSAPSPTVPGLSMKAVTIKSYQIDTDETIPVCVENALADFLDEADWVIAYDGSFRDHYLETRLEFEEVLEKIEDFLNAKMKGGE